MPRIQKYMTTLPQTIGRDIPISKAKEIMREHRIRHLPVQDAGVLVGVISDRDIKLAESFAGSNELTAEDVMTPDPYTVPPDTALDQVVNTMAEHKYGSVIVRQGNDQIVGIFTATDALQVLGSILNQYYEPL